MHPALLLVGEVEGREECKHERVTKTVSMTTTGDSLESRFTPNVLSDSERLFHHTEIFHALLLLLLECELLPLVKVSSHTFAK